MDEKLFCQIFHNMMNLGNMTNCAANLNLPNDLNEKYAAKKRLIY